MGPNGLPQLLRVPENPRQRNPGVGAVGRQHDGRVALVQCRRQGGNVRKSEDVCGVLNSSSCLSSHLSSDVAEGAVGGDGPPVLWVRRRVAPLLPVLQREGQTGILQGSQHVQERSLEVKKPANTEDVVG